MELSIPVNQINTQNVYFVDKIQFRNLVAANNVQINAASATSTMMLMEISA